MHVLVEESRGNAEEAGQERRGEETRDQDPFHQEHALRLLTSWFNSGQPSARKDLGRG